MGWLVLGRSVGLLEDGAATYVRWPSGALVHVPRGEGAERSVPAVRLGTGPAEIDGAVIEREGSVVLVVSPGGRDVLRAVTPWLTRDGGALAARTLRLDDREGKERIGMIWRVREAGDPTEGTTLVRLAPTSVTLLLLRALRLRRGAPIEEWAESLSASRELARAAPTYDVSFRGVARTLRPPVHLEAAK